jgi:molybdate transport system regulatory protein
MKLTYKVWIDNKGFRAFGEGPYRLLKGVEVTGSLWEAAAGMGMAYSKARLIVSQCERSLGFALTVRKTGGASGGGSEVTAEGAELMKAYETIRAEIEDAVGEAYEKHFGHSVLIQFYATAPRKRGKKKPAE